MNSVRVIFTAHIMVINTCVMITSYLHFLFMGFKMYIFVPFKCLFNMSNWEVVGGGMK